MFLLSANVVKISYICERFDPHLGIKVTCLKRRLTENVFKRISANSKPNLNTNFHPNPEAQQRFRENEMTLFFEQVSGYPQLVA